MTRTQHLKFFTKQKKYMYKKINKKYSRKKQRQGKKLSRHRLVKLQVIWLRLQQRARTFGKGLGREGKGLDGTGRESEERAREKRQVGGCWVTRTAGHWHMTMENLHVQSSNKQLNWLEKLMKNSDFSHWQENAKHDYVISLNIFIFIFSKQKVWLWTDIFSFFL